jgi:hypothetical protein
VKRIGQAGDRGRDVVYTNHDGELVIVQCKQGKQVQEKGNAMCWEFAS